MGEIFGSIWWLLVSLGVLVTIHEFGHYWVARRCGVKVLRFSVGFGKPLWIRRGKDGTEFAIGAIPLGGYVKMLGEHTLEEHEEIPADQLAQSHDRQPVWKRMAISVAGPAANLILCIVLLWGMFVIGRPDYAPVVGRVDGIAAAAGLQRGDELLAVGERETPSWTDAEAALMLAALDRQDVEVRVRDAEGIESKRTLRLSHLPEKFDERRAVEMTGLNWRHEMPAPVIGRVRPNGPAWGVLAEGDRITAIDGEPVTSWMDIAPLVRKLGERGGTAMIEVQRGDDRLAMELAPKWLPDESGKNKAWRLSIDPANAELPPRDRLVRLGPLAAIPAALKEMPYQTRQIFAMARMAFSGQVSVRNTVSGPITIARASNHFAHDGPGSYLWLLALLSLSLGILNLLPIPILDGGHLLYYLIELVKGSPVSERVMAAGNFVGLALIAGLMGLAFYNDIVNNLVH